MIRITLLLCVLFLVKTNAVQWTLSGNTAWASGCDWTGNDLSSVQTTGDKCGGFCVSTAGCTHFTWANWNGGTCYMKTNWYSPTDAVGSTATGGICGYIINWQTSGNVQWAPYCDFTGNDLSSSPTTSDQCGATCSGTAGCTHFTWTNYNSGTCWMKQNAVSKNDAFVTAAVGTICGIVSGSPPPPPPPPPPSNSACPKRGLAYNAFPTEADFAAVAKGISWWYNWASNPSGESSYYKKYGVEYVPMIWGAKSLPTTVPSGSKYCLGFNEPNYNVQANLPASSAANLWPQVRSTAYAAYSSPKLVSPAVNYCGPASSCNDMDPINWLKNFFAACQGCQVDHIAVHWYDCTASALQNFLTSVKQFKKPIWVTEIACGPWSSTFQNNQQFQTNYMKQAVQILENDPMVFRYSWFTGRFDPNNMPFISVLGANGVLTDLGSQYLSQPCGPTVNAEISEVSATSSNSGLSQDMIVVIALSVSMAIGVLLIIVIIVALHKQKKFKEIV